MDEYIEFIEQNLDKINWSNLSYNPVAIHLLEANPEKINWYSLSFNPAAIRLLKANPNKINWYIFGSTPQEDYTYYLEQIENNTSYILK